MLQQLASVLTAVLLFFAAVTPVLLKSRPISVAVTGKPLPDSLGGWRAMSFTGEGIGIEQFSFDHTLSRTYQNRSGERIILEIGYVANQSGWQSVASHTKRLTQGVVALPVISIEGPVRVNQFVQENGSRRKLSIFLYLVQGRVLVEPLWVRVFAAWGAITEGRSNGAFVAVTRDLDQGQPETSIQAQSAALLRLVWPLVKDQLEPS